MNPQIIGGLITDRASGANNPNGLKLYGLCDFIDQDQERRGYLAADKKKSALGRSLPAIWFQYVSAFSISDAYSSVSGDDFRPVSDVGNNK